MAKRHVVMPGKLLALPRIAAMKPFTPAWRFADRMGSPHVSAA